MKQISPYLIYLYNKFDGGDNKDATETKLAFIKPTVDKYNESIDWDFINRQNLNQTPTNTKTDSIKTVAAN